VGPVLLEEPDIRPAPLRWQVWGPGSSGANVLALLRRGASRAPAVFVLSIRQLHLTPYKISNKASHLGGASGGLYNIDDALAKIKRSSKALLTAGSAARLAARSATEGLVEGAEAI